MVSKAASLAVRRSILASKVFEFPGETANCEVSAILSASSAKLFKSVTANTANIDLIPGGSWSIKTVLRMSSPQLLSKALRRAKIRDGFPEEDTCPLRSCRKRASADTEKLLITLSFI